MNPAFVIPLLFAAIVLSAWMIGTYNRFIKYKNRIEESLNSIDVTLKRRANLIPNLVRIIKGYSDHEGKIFQEKTRQLSMLSDPKRVEQEQKIARNIGGLIAVAEAYPDLKASSNYLELQNSLNKIEQDIQQARNRYNGYIARFNTLVDSFPASLLARRFHFEKMDYLALELATQREMPNVSFSSTESTKNE